VLVAEPLLALTIACSGSVVVEDVLDMLLPRPVFFASLRTGCGTSTR
jgi:hypothetical protein